MADGLGGFFDQQEAAAQGGQISTPQPLPGGLTGFNNQQVDLAQGKIDTAVDDPSTSTQTRGSTGSSDNLPLDERWHSPTPWAGRLFQGKICRHDNPSRSVYFLFNPSQIQMGLGYSEGQFNPNLTDINAESRALTNSLTTWGFSLLFDRHFEVTGGDPNGVLRDLMAFEQMMGFSEPHMGVIDPSPYDWFLGKYFYLFGQITVFTMDLTLFNPDMIPMRGEIRIQGQGLFGSGKQFGAAGSGTAAAPSATPAPSTTLDPNKKRFGRPF